VIAAGLLHERIEPGGSPRLISRHLDNVCDRVRPNRACERAAVSSMLDIDNEGGA